MQIFFLSAAKRAKKLTQLGDELQSLSAMVDWNVFRPVLQEAIPQKSGPKGGRPPFDRLLMFKILVLKRLYSLSYAETEYQINDRISFLRFLGLDLNGTVPDAKTIWRYEKALSQGGTLETLWWLFDAQLAVHGCTLREGKLEEMALIRAKKP